MPGDKGAKTKPSVHTKKFKQMYGETRKEAYDIGHDYAKHAVSITGQDGYDPNYQGGSYKPSSRWYFRKTSSRKTNGYRYFCKRCKRLVNFK